jgi:hypothetical protein
VKPATGHNYITALVVDPAPSPKPPEAPLSGIGEIVWASPPLAKALGGSRFGNLAGTAKVYPLKPQNARDKVQRGVQFFDDGGIPLNDVIKGIVDDAVKSNQLPANGGGLFKSTIAGAEILLELTSPSEKSVLEKMLSISLHGIALAEPLTDLVPHLAHAKPYLMAIFRVGDQLHAAVQTRASEAQALNPPRLSYPSKPRAAK